MKNKDLGFCIFCQVERTGLSRDTSEWLRGLAWGRDSAEVFKNLDKVGFSKAGMQCFVLQVKASGQAASIGLEDRFMGIKDQEGVKEKLAWLIGRLSYHP